MQMINGMLRCLQFGSKLDASDVLDLALELG